MIARVDPDSLAELQRLVAIERDIPEELCGRIRGGTLAELRADAEQLAVMLGLETPDAPQDRVRDAQGRFSGSAGMTDQIRRGAGRQAGTVLAGESRTSQEISQQIRESTGRPSPAENKPQTGDIGVGRGSAAAGRRAPASMNSKIRAAAAIRKHTIEDLAPRYD